MRFDGSPCSSLFYLQTKHEGKKTVANSSWYRARDDMDKMRSIASCGSMDQYVSTCSAYKQKLKALGYFLDEVDATDEDHEEYVRGLIDSL